MSTRNRPGVPQDDEMDARIERIRQRVRPGHDPTVRVRVDESIKRVPSPAAEPVEPDPAEEFQREWWRGRTAKVCRGCGESFVPEFRANVYCSACTAARRGTVEEASRVVDARHESDGPSGSPGSSAPDSASPPPSNVRRLPLRAGVFTPHAPKFCGCGAVGEWPGRKCPDCKSGRVRRVA